MTKCGLNEYDVCISCKVCGADILEMVNEKLYDIEVKRIKQSQLMTRVFLIRLREQLKVGKDDNL